MWRKTGTGVGITQVWKLHNSEEPGLKFSYCSTDKERLQQICDCLNEHLPKKTRSIDYYLSLDYLGEMGMAAKLQYWGYNSLTCNESTFLLQSFSALKPALNNMSYRVKVIDSADGCTYWQLFYEGVAVHSIEGEEGTERSGARIMASFYLWVKEQAK